MRVPMIATKDLTYATRRLKADDAFEASRSDARVLTALGRGRLVEGEVKKPASAPADERDALRAAYQNKVGKRPFMGWDADTLRAKIAAAD